MASCVCFGMNADCPLCHGTGIVVCPLCDGTGYLARTVKTGNDPFGEHTYEYVPCPHNVNRPHVSNVNGLRDGMESWTFDKMIRQYPALIEAETRIKQILQAGRGWGVFYGPYGIGKTYLLAAAANFAGTMGKTVRFVNTSLLIDELHAAVMGQHDRTMLSIMRELVDDTFLLCLNEFGDFKATDWKLDRVKVILECRSDPIWKPTLFATNRTGNEIARIMPWLADRFRKQEVFESVLLGVPSLRKADECQTIMH